MMSSPTSEEDEALSAALGWPGGISEPLLDRAALLRLVASATVELASMRRCFEAADRERKGKTMSNPRWPHRYKYMSSMGYVVWRDVFEGQMKCPLDDAVKTHKVAVFVTEMEASNYCEYRNAMTVKHGTDDESVIRFGT